LWQGEAIEYLFEPESEGLWNITIIVYDEYGNSAADSVLITVKIHTSGIGDTTLFLIVVSSVGVAAAAIILIYRKKNLSG